MSSPTTLGRYQVLRHLATGGMAEVLLAYETSTTGQPHYVVIKRIRPDQAKDHQFVEMFLDEARISGVLHHPNIVRVFDTGEQNGEFYFAMEYVHGEDLRRVLVELHRQKDQLPIALVTGLVVGVAAGLHHAHKQLGPDGEPLGIVHRDVSPANILVGYDGSVKVADFGIAKAALRTVETRSGTLKGKVSYMSPEQVTGRPVDRRSDVFALGIVLYEVATARRLFKGDNDFLTMAGIVSGDIPKPSLYRPDLPRVLEDIILTALAADPKDRFQSAEEMGEALTTFIASLGMRMSAGSIADYMRKLFGSRAEPWLVDDEPTMTTSIDFDGSASGVVHSPAAAALMKTPLPGSSPMAYAMTDATGLPPPPQPAGWTSAAPLRKSTEHRPRSRRLLVTSVIGGVAAVVAGIAIVARSPSPSSTTEPAAARVTEPPPPATPTPTPTPEPVAPAPVAPAPAPAPAPKVAKVPAPVAPKVVPPPPPLPKVAASKPPVQPKPAHPKPTAKPNPPDWDPNALFAPK